jgi:hypothetical protein
LEPIQTTANESGLLSLFLAHISQCSIYSGRKILHTQQHLSAVNISRRFYLPAFFSCFKTAAKLKAAVSGINAG